MSNDLTQLTGEDLANKRGVVVASHPRSGTHLLIDVLRRQFPPLAVKKPLLAPLGALYVSLDAILIERSNHPAVERAVYGLKNHRIPIIKVHWTDPEFSNIRSRNDALAQWLINSTSYFYTVRHPEKVLSSLFAFEYGIDSGVGNRGDEWLEDKGRYWINHVSQWVDKPGVRVVRFEDVLASPESVLREIASHLNLIPKVKSPIVPASTETLWRNRLQRLAYQPVSTAILSLHPKRALSELFSQHALDRFRESSLDLRKRFKYEFA